MLTLIFCAFLALVAFHEFYWKRRKYPPGPTPLPIVGNVLTVLNSPPGYDVFIKWSKIYGPVFTYWMGPMPTVIIADFNVLRETVIRQPNKFADRFTGDFTELVRGGNYGIAETNGAIWQEIRQFSMQVLREFGMGTIMEEKILSEVIHLCNALRNNSTAVETQWQFDLAVGSVINNLLFGYRFDEDKQDEFRYLKTVLGKHFKNATNLFCTLGFSVPWSRKLPLVKPALDGFFENLHILYTFYRRQIRELRQHVDYDSETSTNFVEAFLKKQKTHETEANFGNFSDAMLENVLMDLWIAGMESTSNTLTWGVAYALNNPKVQQNIHAELSLKIEAGKVVTLADKRELPYLCAFINEVQRLANILPVNMFRKTSEQVNINGHEVARDTIIIPQISAILYDEKIFPEPYEFKPERFLNSDGSVKQFDEFVPFSVGKRRCPGEALAKMELFLFMANIFQNFEVSAEATPSIKKSSGFTMCCSPFTCDFTYRNS